MGFLENLRERKRERTERERRFEEDHRISDNFHRKKMSHVEREMVAILTKEKEQHLKDALKFEELRRKREELFKERQMMRGHINLWN